MPRRDDILARARLPERLLRGSPYRRRVLSRAYDDKQNLRLLVPEWDASWYSRTGESAYWDIRTHTFKGGSEAENWLSTDVPVVIRRYGGNSYYLAYEAITNRITNTDLQNWTEVGSPTTTSGVEGPDRSDEAVSVDDASAVAAGYLTRDFTAAATGTHTIRVFCRKDEVTSRFPGIAVAGNTATLSGTSGSLIWNTSTGAKLITEGTAIQSSQVNDAGDWWDVAITVSVTGTGTVTLELYPAKNETFATGGTEVSAIGSAILALPQAVAGTHPHAPPIRTAGTTVTRGGDVMQVPNASINPLFFTQGFQLHTVPVEASASFPVAPARAVLWLTTGTNTFIRHEAFSGEEIRFRADGSENLLTPSSSALDELTHSIAWGGLHSALVNGSLADSDNITGNWDDESAEDLYVGCRNTGVAQANAMIALPVAL